MKKSFFTFCLLACLSLSVYSSDFQDLPWGTSSADVINRMGTTKSISLCSGRLHLEYDICFNDKDYSVFFIFKDNRLSEKLLCLKKPLLMDEMVLEEFEDLQKTMTRNYGSPVDIVDSSSFQKTENERMVWRTDDTLVDMELSSHTHRNSLALAYLPN